MIENKTYQLIYKCELCGEYCFPETQSHTMLTSFHNVTDVPSDMFMEHMCNANQYGLAKFIGVRERSIAY